jgi:flagellar biosynthesis protein FliQ
MDQRILDFILRVTNEGLLMILVVCGPPILLSMIVGFAVSVFQAVTQIQEQTLTFVPKMIIIFASLAALGPWLGGMMLSFARLCFEGFPEVMY